MPETIPGGEQTPHQEIAELERLLAEKKQALADESAARPERELFRETFRETYGEALSPQTPPPSTDSTSSPQANSGQTPSLPPDELAKHAAALAAQEREEQLESLIAIAISKGVTAAAGVARRATPWLMDELHDRLCDRYYQHLIASRQLKAL
ncbi:MAG: hypothetical protein Q8R35_03940 [bacterium]|nr:hypothetical protein [bacterium]